MMVSNDKCDLVVVLDIRQDALADDRVLLHEASFFAREGPRLLQQSGRQTDFANVVHETTEMGELLLPRRER